MPLSLSAISARSYARFLDARKAWGSVTNRSRDLARQGLAYLPPSQPELPALLCRWIVAFRCGGTWACSSSRSTCMRAGNGFM